MSGKQFRIFTKEGLDWVSHRTMKKVMTDTFPDLKNNTIPDNAFKTWQAKVSPAEARQ